MNARRSGRLLVGVLFVLIALAAGCGARSGDGGARHNTPGTPIAGPFGGPGEESTTTAPDETTTTTAPDDSTTTTGPPETTTTAPPEPTTTTIPGVHREGGAWVLYRKCLNDDCSKPENVTEFAVLDSPGNPLPAGSNGHVRMRIARDPATGRDATTVEFTGHFEFDPKTMTFTAVIQSVSPWENAGGIKGLQLTSWQGTLAICFTTWTYGLTLEAEGNLPDAVTKDIGIDPGAVGLKGQFSGSWQNPLPAMVFRAALGGDKFDPGVLAGGSVAGSGDPWLTVDQGAFVIAPSGGDMDGRHYQPGWWLSFDGKLLSNAIHVDGKYDNAAHSLHVEGAVPAFDLAVAKLTDGKATFDKTPRESVSSLGGKLTIPGLPTMDATGRYSGGGSPKLVFDGGVTDFRIGPVHMSELHAHLVYDLTDKTFTETGGSATVDLNGTPVGIAVTLVFDQGTFVGFSGNGKVEHWKVSDATTIDNVALQLDIRPDKPKFGSFTGAVTIAADKPTTAQVKGSIQAVKQAGIEDRVTVTFEGAGHNFDISGTHVDDLAVAYNSDSGFTATAKLTFGEQGTIDFDGVSLTWKNGWINGFNANATAVRWQLIADHKDYLLLEDTKLKCGAGGGVPFHCGVTGVATGSNGGPAFTFAGSLGYQDKDFIGLDVSGSQHDFDWMGVHFVDLGARVRIPMGNVGLMSTSVTGTLALQGGGTVGFEGTLVTDGATIGFKGTGRADSVPIGPVTVNNASFDFDFSPKSSHHVNLGGEVALSGQPGVALKVAGGAAQTDGKWILDLNGAFKGDWSYADFAFREVSAGMQVDLGSGAMLKNEGHFKGAFRGETIDLHGTLDFDDGNWIGWTSGVTMPKLTLGKDVMLKDINGTARVRVYKGDCGGLSFTATLDKWAGPPVAATGGTDCHMETDRNRWTYWLTGDLQDMKIAFLELKDMGVRVDYDPSAGNDVVTKAHTTVGLLGRAIYLDGNLIFKDNRLAGFDVGGSTDPICVDTVCLAGKGNGGRPYFHVVYATPSLKAQLGARLLVGENVWTDLDGTFSASGFDFNGNFHAKDLVDVATKGRFYYGQLQNIEVADAEGRFVPAHDGDWRIDTAKVPVNPPNSGFAADVAFNAGHVQGTGGEATAVTWVGGDAHVKVDNSASKTVFETDAGVKFKNIGTPAFDFDLHGKANGAIGGFKGDLTFAWSKAGVNAKAQVEIPDYNAKVRFEGSGVLTCDKPGSCAMKYSLTSTGEGHFKLQNLTVDVDRFDLRYQGGPDDGLHVVGNVAGAYPQLAFNTHLDTAVGFGGTICATLNATATLRDMPYVKDPLQLGGDVKYCDKKLRGELTMLNDYKLPIELGEVDLLAIKAKAGIGLNGRFKMVVTERGFTTETVGKFSGTLWYDWRWAGCDYSHKTDIGHADAAVKDSKFVVSACINIPVYGDWCFNIYSAKIPFLDEHPREVPWAA